jgi:hypothetical protein
MLASYIRTHSVATMQITLTPHADHLLQQQLARQSGRSAEQIVERALEQMTLTEPEGTASDEDERRRKAVADMQAFAKTHELRLERGGQRLRDLMHEGHKY